MSGTAQRQFGILYAVFSLVARICVCRLHACQSIIMIENTWVTLHISQFFMQVSNVIYCSQ